MALTIKEAEAIVGTLSNPSKMPEYAYSLPAQACHVGSKLREVEGSVCSKCYALKGRYLFPKVQNAMQKRLESIKDPRWVEAMVTLIGATTKEHFRWHDSGDLQSREHLRKIVQVALKLPHIKFWLPTKEKGLVSQFFAGRFTPPNLTIRVAAAMVDQVIAMPGTMCTCSVHKDKEPFGFECRAHERGNQCGDCRACWNREIRNVSYPLH